MPRPSFTLIFSGLFTSWIIYSIYSLSLLFVSPKCDPGRVCLKSILRSDPQLNLHLFLSPSIKTPHSEFKRIHSILNFNYTHEHSIPITVDIPRKTRQNGTLFLHILITPISKNQDFSFIQLEKNENIVYTRIKLTQFMVPEAETFNLLGEKNVKKKNIKPVAHLKSRITFTMVTDVPQLPISLPAELIHHIKLAKNEMFLPIVNYDFLQSRHKDLVKINEDDHEMNMTIIYTPISLGKLRLILHVKTALESVKQMGFSDKDIDEIKGIYADTNAVLLAATIFIASMHMMFDFLAFKNDINFWRSKGSFEGLSVSTIVWRAFSQTIIFLYLLEEKSSLLVLIPAGIGTLIEFWKTKKVLRIQIDRSNIIPKIQIKKDDDSQNKIESKTREFDAESLRYLSYILYPLGISGAIYSLIYQPHKSWYSWSINSLVNGVYAFGFLFMLPQLFVNYKLKSVAHLPWRAFMYKAFNTFIDDVFAFIITMPTAHRVACFRDDIVFLIYLYQRWLYPVDKSRRDTITISEDLSPSINNDISKKKKN